MAANKKKLSVGLISLIVLIAVAILAYLPNSSSDFLLDDHILIENNPFIRQLASPADYLARRMGFLIVMTGTLIFIPAITGHSSI